MLLTDIPYLEPLLFHLRNDESLKSHFTEKSFFMPHHDLVDAIMETGGADCALPKSLWILPQDTEAVQKRVGCKSTGLHTFSIAIAVKCIRNPFLLIKKDGGVHLGGQFMELTEIRKIVKDSVHRFALDNSMNTKFSDLIWTGDRVLYPSEEDQVLIATSINFEIKIF